MNISWWFHVSSSIYTISRYFVSFKKTHRIITEIAFLALFAIPNKSVHAKVLRVHAVYDATRRDNTIATVTELCVGSHLQSSIPYPEPRAKKIIAQILDALQYMHRRKLFHNSLTTENSTLCGGVVPAKTKLSFFSN